MISLKGKTILVVDDEQGYREVLADEFKMVGANLLTANSGSEAFEIILKNNVDAVISDVRMPKGTGIELLDNAKTIDAKRPVVMLITGFSDLLIEDAYDKGAEAIFSKPCDLDRLVSSVHRALISEEERYLRELVQLPSDFVVELTFETLDESIKARVINIGRGGMFIATEKIIPNIDARVSFDVKGRENVIFRGAGVCRWQRFQTRPDLPRGFGLEFLDLNEASLRGLQNLLGQLRPKAYIPKGPEVKY